MGSDHKFTVYTQSSTDPKRPIFTRNYDHGAIWSKGEVTIATIADVQIIFELVTGLARQGSIESMFSIEYCVLFFYIGFVALDDYLFRKGACSFRSDECTFDDKSLCSWTDAIDDQFDWVLGRDTTPTLDTGPAGDHSMLHHLNRF